MEADSKARLLSCCPHASCIRVPSTFVGKDGATIYLLEVTWWPPLTSDMENEGLSWTLSKRFREFDELSGELAAYGTVPALPPKQLFGNRKPSVIEARRVGVEAFLKSCISTPAISNNSVFVRFLEVEQHCEAAALPRSCLAMEITARRVRDSGTMLGVTCFHYYLQEDVLLVTSEDQSLLSRVDSRISNLAAKPNEEVPIGGLLCYKYFGEDEGYELVAQESYQDKATALAFDSERRYVFVGLSSGHVLHYYADLHWSLSAPLADIVCHSLRVSQLCLASDGLLLSISKDRTLRAIDTSESPACSVFHALLPTKHWPLALAWNPKRRLAYVSTLGGEIMGIEVVCEGPSQEPKVVQPAVLLKGHRARVQALHFAGKEKHLFSGGEAGAAGVWNMQHEEVRFCGLLPHGPACAVSCVTYLRPFKLVATGYVNGMVGLWDARGGQLFHIFRAHTTFSTSSTPTTATPTRRSSVSASNIDSMSSSPPSSPKSPMGSRTKHSISSPKNVTPGPHHQPRGDEHHDGTPNAFSWSGPPQAFEEPPLSPGSSGAPLSPPSTVIRRFSKPPLPTKPLPRVPAPSNVSITSSTLLDAAAEAAAQARLEPLVGNQGLTERKEGDILPALSGTHLPATMPSPSPRSFPRSSSQPTLPSSLAPSSHAPSLWASTSSASLAPAPAPAPAPPLPIVGVGVRWLWFDESTCTLISCSDQEVRFWSFPSHHCQSLPLPSMCPSKLFSSPKFPSSPFSSPAYPRTASLLSSESFLAPINLFAADSLPSAHPVVIHPSNPTSTSGVLPSCSPPSSDTPATLHSSQTSSSPQTTFTNSGRASASTSNSDSVSSVRSEDSSEGETKNESGDSVTRRRISSCGESGSHERSSLSRKCSHGREYCSCSRGRESRGLRGSVEPCARCALSVFPTNRVEVLGAAYHTWCLRCRQCGLSLPLPFQGQFFCSLHQPPTCSPTLPPVQFLFHDIHNIRE